MSSNAGRAYARVRSTVLALVGSLAIAACQTASTGPDLDTADVSPPKRMVTQGRAKTIVENLTRCAYTHPKMNVRVAAVGEITATDGTVITMPAVTALQKGARWIWSQNLVLDNVVIARKTVR